MSTTSRLAFLGVGSSMPAIKICGSGLVYANRKSCLQSRRAHFPSIASPNPAILVAALDIGTSFDAVDIRLFACASDIACLRRRCGMDEGFRPIMGSHGSPRNMWLLLLTGIRSKLARTSLYCLIYRIAELYSAVVAFFGKRPYYIHSHFPDPVAKP
jgi:hypothetical protein